MWRWRGRTWVLSGRAVGYVLDLPVIAEPGVRFIYNSGGSHLLSVIAGRAAPPNALDFAARNLFGPLQLRSGGYGYQTWADATGTGSIAALGYGGQIV